MRLVAAGVQYPYEQVSVGGFVVQSQLTELPVAHVAVAPLQEQVAERIFSPSITLRTYALELTSDRGS